MFIFCCSLHFKIVGGILIMTSLVLFLINTIYLKQTLESALAMKRFHHQLQPMYVRLEEGFDDDDLRGFLESKGHETREANTLLSAFASIIALWKHDGIVETGEMIE
jgi:gamma-glutamyltranspeptidase